MNIAAASTRYVHIRMNNPDGRQIAYLLFTTKANPVYDRPGDGWPVPEEAGGKGVVFSLLPGATSTTTRSTRPPWPAGWAPSRS